MKLFSLTKLAAASLILTSCASEPPPRTADQTTETTYSTRGNGQIDLALASGNYQCELGQNIEIAREYQDKVNHRILVSWKNRNYRLERDNSHSGLPRFKDKNSGLVWVDLPWKGMLLDGKTNKPLANECRSA